MILIFCVFKSLIGTDMTYHFSVDVPLRIESIYLNISTIFRLNLPYVSPSKLLVYLCRDDKAW